MFQHHSCTRTGRHTGIKGYNNNISCAPLALFSGFWVLCHNLLVRLTSFSKSVTFWVKVAFLTDVKANRGQTVRLQIFCSLNLKEPRVQEEVETC